MFSQRKFFHVKKLISLQSFPPPRVRIREFYFFPRFNWMDLVFMNILIKCFLGNMPLWLLTWTICILEWSPSWVILLLHGFRDFLKNWDLALVIVRGYQMRHSLGWCDYSLWGGNHRNSFNFNGWFNVCGCGGTLKRRLN